MTTKKTRQKFSDIVQRKRKLRNFDQKTLGQRIWPNVSETAAQSRISRIERGDYWPDAGDIVKIIDELVLWDDILNQEENEEKIFLDSACEKFIPTINMIAKMLSKHAKENNASEFFTVMHLLCEISITNEKKHLSKLF